MAIFIRDLQISDFRLSVIFCETYLYETFYESPVQSPVNFIRKSKTYKEKFGEIRCDGDKDLSLPWQSSGKNNFWKHYLGNISLRSVSENIAWKKLVPIRENFSKPRSKKISAPQLPKERSRFYVEGFYYPHGIAVIININIQEELSLEEVVDVSIKFQEEKYKIDLDADSMETYGLESVADEALVYLRERSLGKDSLAGKRLGSPFTVATVVRGTDIGEQELSRSIKPNSELHRAVEGLCTFSKTWRYDELHNLDSSKIEIRKSPPSHLLYGLRRSRAVWFPASFRETDQNYKTHKLSCYHRNLTLASLQTEMLGSLLGRSVDCIKQGKKLPSRLYKLTREVLDSIDELSSATHKTYRSNSVSRQIDDNYIGEYYNSHCYIFPKKEKGSQEDKQNIKEKPEKDSRE